MPSWMLVWFALLAMNALAFTLWGIDKARARRGQWRIREQDLLLLALLGGIGGAWLGRWYFRHKSRKTGFSAQLHVIAMLELGMISAWLVMRS